MKAQEDLSLGEQIAFERSHAEYWKNFHRMKNKGFQKLSIDHKAKNKGCWVRLKGGVS